MMVSSTKKRLKNAVGALNKVIQRARLGLEIKEIINGNGDAKKLMVKYGLK
jgi:hypothetical protein